MSQQQLTVVYDGHCAICLASMEKVERMFGNRVRQMDFRVVPPAEIHPDLTEERCQARMHVLKDGQVYGGAAAVVQIMRMHPVLRWPVMLYYVPPFGWLAERIYEWVARNRFRLSRWLPGKQPVCTDACQIHIPPKDDQKR